MTWSLQRVLALAQREKKQTPWTAEIWLSWPSSDSSALDRAVECKIPTTGVVSICWSELFHGNKHCPPIQLFCFFLSLKCPGGNNWRCFWRQQTATFSNTTVGIFICNVRTRLKVTKLEVTADGKNVKCSHTHTHKATRTITFKPLTQHFSTLTVCYCGLVLALLHKETLHRRCSGPLSGNAIISALRWRATASRWLLARLKSRQSADTVQDKLNKHKRNWTKSRRFEKGFASCSNNNNKKLGLYQGHEWRVAPLLEATQSSEHRK